MTTPNMDAPLHSPFNKQIKPDVLLQKAKQQAQELSAEEIDELYVLKGIQPDQLSTETLPIEIASSDLAQFISPANSDSSKDSEVIEGIHVAQDAKVVDQGKDVWSSKMVQRLENSPLRLSASIGELEGAPPAQPRPNGQELNQLMQRFEKLENEMMETLKLFRSHRDENKLQVETQKATAALQELLNTDAGKQALAQFGYVKKNIDPNEQILQNMAMEGHGKRPIVDNDNLAILKGAAGNAQLGSVETGTLGKSVPEVFLKDLSTHKNIQQVHEAAKKLLKSFSVKDQELHSIEKLIVRLHDIDAKRYKMVDTVLKGITLTGFGVAGVIALLGAVGVIASAAATVSASLIGIPAGMMLGAGVGWFVYKTIRNSYQAHKQEKWLEVARHEGKYYDKMKKTGMSDVEIDLKAQHKLASTHPQFATLVLWNRLREAAHDMETFEKSTTYQYLSVYGFKHDQMLALAKLDNPDRAVDLMSKKLGLPLEEEEWPVFG